MTKQQIYKKLSNNEKTTELDEIKKQRQKKIYTKLSNNDKTT